MPVWRNPTLIAGAVNRYNAAPAQGGDVPQRFVPGQRWLSEAEPDLGLGSVESFDGRLVLIDFPASAQKRTYAAQTAPLGRVRFAADDKIRDREGTPLIVREVHEQGGLFSYDCVDQAGRRAHLPEQSLDDHLRLNRPQDKLLARRIDADIWFSLRYRAWLQSAALWRSPVFGLQGPRIDLIPHQLFIATEVASRSAPRVLLADEVGLGKTIEAGLILHRLLLTERVRRVLIVVPDALVNQWLVEMLRRFNLAFAVFDTERFAASAEENPFHAEQRVLCSLSFLTTSPATSAAVVAGEWDLLIVDEAHHLAWSEQGASGDYQVVEALSSVTPAVLLLTATPEQLGRAGHFGRLRLLDPQRFHDYHAFLEEEAAYVPVASLAAKLLDGMPLDDSERAQLRHLLGDEAGLPAQQSIERLIDRHGTGRVLFRNTRHAVTGFPKRRLHAYRLSLPDAYAGLAVEPTPEVAAGGGWTDLDPRVAWLRELLLDLAPLKVLVICARAETAIALRDHLLERCAIHAALFHEHMEIVARDRAAAFFADPDEGTQVLISSEIGSEGRNFQFAHHLVLFDLPCEPDLLEQRIGRLDRIGQREIVAIHVPYLEGAASEVLLRWYRDALASFEAVCPAAGAVYAQLADRLQSALGDAEQVPSLIADAAALTRRINTELEAGRDRLLELHSHRPERAAALLTALRADSDAALLRTFMDDYWDAFGVEHETAGGQAIVLRPGPHMLHEHFPGLGGEAATATFSRNDALAHEDRLFLTWEHPMVRGCMEMLTSGELGSAAVTVVSHPDYRTGTLFVEVLCVVECSAPQGLALQRYLPPTCLRLLLDAQGRDCSTQLAHADLQGLCLSQNRKLADTVLKSQAERVKALLRRATELAERAGAERAVQALDLMQADLTDELQRLESLARVNPNVRREEIQALATHRERMAAQIGRARVRLDAIRLIVMR